MKPAKTLSILELFQLFNTESKAVKWLENIRWNNKVSCAHCQSNNISTAKSKSFTYWCGSCRKHFTVRTGTIMGSSKISLQKWVIAIYYFLTARKGISSLQLSKELGITQKSAWFMAQRIRNACSGNGLKLEGIVEIDETYIGGKEKNKHVNKRTKGTQGRSTKTKSSVVGIRSRDGKVKMGKIKNVNTKTMQAIIDSNIETGSTLCTDEVTFYKGIKGYQKFMVNHSVGEFVNGMGHVNGVESVWAVLKRGYHGTFHHFSKKHMDRYVDEFSFRLNEGNCAIDTIDRMESLWNGGIGKRITYKELIA